PEPHRTDRNPRESDDRGADGPEHPAKLALPALAGGCAGPAQLRLEAGPEDAAECLPLHVFERPEWLRKSSPPFLQPDSGCERADLLLVQRSGERHGVFA